MLYRIFTEDKNHAQVEKIIAQHFEGFTIVKADGYWKLIKEGALVIEIVTPSTNRAKVDRVAKAIKEYNTQEAVLVQEIKNNQWLV